MSLYSKNQSHLKPLKPQDQIIKTILKIKNFTKHKLKKHDCIKYHKLQIISSKQILLVLNNTIRLNIISTE